jgi:hypothetical protein
MALKKITKDGYGQLELNLVAFPRTGRVVAQYAAGATFTGAEGDDRYLENGMLLKVDGANRCVDKANPAEGDVFALNYSTEHMYDERKYALKTFRLDSVNDFYPRLGYLAEGDKYTTNCVCYDTDEFANDAALMEALANYRTTPIYAGACELGYEKLSKTLPEYGPALRVIEVYTMPDGQFGVKLEAIRG